MAAIISGREIETPFRKFLMKRLSKIVLAVFLMACTSATKHEIMQDDSLLPAPPGAGFDTAVAATLEGSWQLQPVLPSDTAAGKIPTLVFDLTSKKFQGNTGCNSMNGSFYLAGDSLSFDEQIVMTRMACPGYNEKIFMENLIKTNRYKIETGILQLMQEQTILSKWIRKDSVAQKKI